MSQIEITPDTIISRSEMFLSNNLGDDVVMMNIEHGTYFSLESVAARIWKLTEQPISVGSLCGQLINEYRISPEQCQQEVKAFLNDLLNQKIVQLVN